MHRYTPLLISPLVAALPRPRIVDAECSNIHLTRKLAELARQHDGKLSAIVPTDAAEYCALQTSEYFELIRADDTAHAHSACLEADLLVATRRSSVQGVLSLLSQGGTAYTRLPVLALGESGAGSLACEAERALNCAVRSFSWPVFGGLTLVIPCALLHARPTLETLSHRLAEPDFAAHLLHLAESARADAVQRADSAWQALGELHRRHGKEIERLGHGLFVTSTHGDDSKAALIAQWRATGAEREREVCALNARLSELESRVRDLDALLSESQANLHEATARLQAERGRVKTATQALAALQRDSQRKLDAASACSARLQALIGRVCAQGLRDAAAAVRARDELETRIKQLDRQLATAREQWVRSEARAHAREALRHTLHTRVAASEMALQEALGQHTMQAERISELESAHAEQDRECRTLSRALDDASRKIVEYEARYERSRLRLAEEHHLRAGVARKLERLRDAFELAETDLAALQPRGLSGVFTRAVALSKMSWLLMKTDHAAGRGWLRLPYYSYLRWRRHGVNGSVERLKKEFRAVSEAQPGMTALESPADAAARLGERLTYGRTLLSELVGKLDPVRLPARAAGPSSGTAPAQPLTLTVPVTTAQPPVSVSAPPDIRQAPKLKLTVLVVTWDVGHNPLGRSYMLAEVLDRVVRNVVLCGFQFPRYGDAVWEPVRQGRLPVVTLPGGELPDFLDALDSIARRCRPDVVIACKPRLPSVLLGALIKRHFGCPLIVDIDDHERSFFHNKPALDLPAFRQLGAGTLSSVTEPYAEPWTLATESLCTYADALIVSNIALAREFGGTLLPHVRDESAFDPAKYDRTALCVQYGLQVNRRYVLFFGTPRHHKGVDVLAAAVSRIEDPRFRLLIVGTAPDRSVTAKLDQLSGGRIDYLPNQPFSSVPAILALASVVCLPQDTAHPISQYQLPAKAIDAVAMGVPLLVSDTPPLRQLVDDGVARLLDHERLPQQLVEAAELRAIDGNARQRFLDHYSYAAGATRLRKLLETTLTHPQQPQPELLDAWMAAFRRALDTPAPIPAPRARGVDVVVLWKQNDTGLYGRRSDMLIDYLASRDDVRRVVVFDAPISEFDLQRRRDAGDAPTQDRLLYLRTYEKHLGKHDTPKISYNVMIHPPGVYATGERDTGKPRLTEGFGDFIADVLAREQVDTRKAVFWLYPRSYHAPDLVARFTPARVVVDVVDDHRAWPGVSAEERARLTDNYRQCLALADMAFVNCEPVAEAMQEFHSHIRLVPNGCEETPTYRAPRHDAQFEIFKTWPGETIGYVGNLEQKIDIALLAKVAEAFPDCQLALIGSTHANPQVRHLAQYPNVRLPGVVPYDQVGAWIERFDVGIIPHLNLDMTQRMNPLKLFVYLSWGVPVVSTEIYNLDRSAPWLKVASDHAEFLDHIAGTLASSRPDETAIRDYVRANSWRARFTPHVDELLVSFTS